MMVFHSPEKIWGGGACSSGLTMGFGTSHDLHSLQISNNLRSVVI